MLAEIITLRAIALKLLQQEVLVLLAMRRDHNATSYSTETENDQKQIEEFEAEIITLRAIALKHRFDGLFNSDCFAEIITLRAIALKLLIRQISTNIHKAAEIITLRAIALKLLQCAALGLEPGSRDHNATSYSTETRAILLLTVSFQSRDHNATSYSTET